MNRGLSFNATTGEKESSQAVWEGSTWEKMGRARGRTMDRSNSFVGQANTNPKDVTGVIAIVDPFSTGAHLAAEVCKRGYKCARVLSVWDSPIASLVQEGIGNVDYCATIQHNDQLKDQDFAINEVIVITIQSQNLPTDIVFFSNLLDCASPPRFTLSLGSGTAGGRNWCRVS
jgi:hypothetical protein